MYDLIIEFEDGSDSLIIPELLIDEVVDFMEEYTEATIFTCVRTVI